MQRMVVKPQSQDCKRCLEYMLVLRASKIFMPSPVWFRECFHRESRMGIGMPIRKKRCKVLSSEHDMVLTNILLQKLCLPSLCLKTVNSGLKSSHVPVPTDPFYGGHSQCFKSCTTLLKGLITQTG